MQNITVEAQALGPEYIGMIAEGTLLNNGYMQDIYAPIVAILFNYEDAAPQLDTESTKGELVNINVQTLFYTFSYAPTSEVTLHA